MQNFLFVQLLQVKSWTSGLEHFDAKTENEKSEFMDLQPVLANSGSLGHSREADLSQCV